MAKKRKKHHGGRASEELLQKWKEELIRKRGKPKTPKERRGIIIVESSPQRQDARSILYIKTIGDVEAAVKCFTWPTLKYNREDDFYIQDIIGGDKRLMEHYHQKMKNYFGIEHVLRKEEKARKARTRKTNSTLPSNIQKIIIKNSIAKKKENTPLNEQVKTKPQEPAFNVLKPKAWILDWSCVKFKKDYIVVFPPNDKKVIFKPKAVSAPGSLESFNYLNDYFNDRLAPVHCSVEGMELDVYDTIRLYDAILKFAAVARQRHIGISAQSVKTKISPATISFNNALSKAKQMSIEDFKKYKSQHIDFLVSIQSPNYKVIPCVERLAHTNSDTTEYAFMFTIECPRNVILVVYENINPDRSTLLFLLQKESYKTAIREIYDFLQSAETNKRSNLREKNIELKQSGVRHYRSINHDDFWSWKRNIIIYKH